MFALSPLNLAFALMISGMSFVNLVFSLGIEKEKSIWRIMSVVFAVPLLTGVVSLFQGEQFFIFQMHHLALLILFLFFPLGLYWKKSGQYGSTLRIVLSLALLSPFAVFCLQSISGYSWTLFLLAGFTGFLAVGNILIFAKIFHQKETTLSVGFSLLGAGQLFGLFLGAHFPEAEAVLIFAAFFLFMYTFWQKIYRPVLIRLEEAEKKLLDVDRTVKFEVQKRVIEIERHNEHLINLAQTDSLTGILNKQAITNIIRSLTEGEKKNGFTVLLFDIDDFKKINDTKGHLAGDMYLKLVAGIAKDNSRTIDHIGRYGGDEFIIVLPHTKLAEGLCTAERFRKKVEDSEAGITVSVGVAHFPEDGEIVRDLLVAADVGLYKSKERGKNIVSHFRSLNDQNGDNN